MARTISTYRCFVVVSGGYGISMGTPDEMYYEGETDEESTAARAAAQAEVDSMNLLCSTQGVRLSYRASAACILGETPYVYQ